MDAKLYGVIAPNDISQDIKIYFTEPLQITHDMLCWVADYQ